MEWFFYKNTMVVVDFFIIILVFPEKKIVKIL